MTLEEQINADIKAAMLSKNQAKLETLRAIKAAILLLKTSAEGLTPSTETKALQKMVKQRKETAGIYTTQNREDLAAIELAQATIIETYLPTQMGEAELRTEITKIIALAGASSPADMGKIMGIASKQLAGKTDGKAISMVVKELLDK